MNILGLVEISNWILLGLFIIISFYLYSKWKLSLFKRLGIPGPPPSFLIGNGGTFKKLGFIEADKELVAKYGSLLGVYMGTIPSVIISDPELIKTLLIKDFSKNPNRPRFIKVNSELEHGVSILEGDHWRVMRSTLSATFSSGKMRKMESMLNQKCKILIDVLRKHTSSGKSFECKQVCGNYTMDCIAALGFGMDIDSQNTPNNEFVINAKKAFDASKTKWLWVIVIFPFVDALLNLFGMSPFNDRKVFGFFRTAVEKAIEMRDDSDKGKQDLLQMMLNAHHETEDDENETDNNESDQTKVKKKGLTKDEVVGNAMLFMIAGYETTATALTFALYCLATNPSCQDKLYEEIVNVVGDKSPTYDDIQKMEYLDCVFNEGLRLYSPAARVSRVAENDFELGGYKIPKDTDLSVPIYVLHYSPKYWPDPKKFDPERFSAANKSNRNPYAFLPFGLGPRNCIAMRLAHMEAKFAIIHILKNFRIVTCDETEIPITLSKAGLVKPENDVNLKLQER